MTKIYRNTALFTLFLTLVCTCVRAQTTVAVMNFDGTGTEMTVATDVPFFDNHNTNANDGFFGIHDANNNTTDGVPGDTGDGLSNRVNLVNASPISGDFLFINDLEPEADDPVQFGTNGFATITFGPVDITGLSSVTFAFDYIKNFAGFDEASYQVFADNVGQGSVDIPNGAGSVSACIPDGRSSIYLELKIKQNGEGDNAGFDNFMVLADTPGFVCADPCGITGFGPETVACITESGDSETDLFRIEIPYSGFDADATLLIEAGVTSPDNDVTATTTNVGDDFTSTADGTIILENAAGEFEEGDQIRVTLTDGGGGCSFVLNINTAENECANPCDFSVNPADLRLICSSLFSMQNVDQVEGALSFTGSEPGVTVSISGALGSPMIVSGDPATDNDGQIVFNGLVEGASYTITFSGGVCPTTAVPFSVPSNFCTPGDLIFNEILADPGNDANGDGTFSTGQDEFVEIYNTSTTDLDVSGYSVEERAGQRFVFPPGSTIPGNGIFVVFAGGVPTNLPCETAVANVTPFLSLNNGDDVVILRDASGTTVSQYAYFNGPTDESMALSPDFNQNQTYVPHTTIAANPVASSPCLENGVPNAALPVDLTAFNAEVEGKTVRLSWETEREVNNDHFLVQRLSAGARWATLGNVPALTDRSNTYGFTDEAPVQGENIYRLKQVDMDGSATIYGPVSIGFAANELSVWPNPAGDELRFSGSLTNDASVTLLDANGRVLRALPAGSDRADLSAMPSGIYLLRVARASGTELVRFVKK